MLRIACTANAAGKAPQVCQTGRAQAIEKSFPSYPLVLSESHDDFSEPCVSNFLNSIKMPEEYIEWSVPEGGGGPSYTVM